MKPYEQFREAIGQRESSGNYACVNKLGYLGAYQFGLARLCDLGLTRRKDPKSTGLANAFFEFIAPDGQRTFLNSPILQDECFDLHVQALRRLCERVAPDNLSGAIAACHLLGVGGLTEFVRHKVDSCDAFGTRLSEYYTEFSGYEIPGGLPVKAIAPTAQISLVDRDALLAQEEAGTLATEWTTTLT